MNLTKRAVYLKSSRKKKKKISDRAFLDWLRTQPSALDGAMSLDVDTGQRYCDPCHYRTAKNSGTGCKPLYSAIPLTHEQHLEQHRIGQYNFMPREWWEEKVAYYVGLWGH